MPIKDLVASINSKQAAAESRYSAALHKAVARLLPVALENSDFEPSEYLPPWIGRDLADLDEQIRDLSRNYEPCPSLNAEIEHLRAERRRLRRIREEELQPHEETAAQWRAAARSLEQLLKRCAKLKSDRERIRAFVDSDLPRLRNIMTAAEIRLLNDAALHLVHSKPLDESAGQCQSAKPATPDAPPRVTPTIPPPTEVEIMEGAADILKRLSAGRFDTYEDHKLNLAAQHLSLVTGFEELMCLPMLRHIEQYPFQVNTARQVLRTMRGRALLCDEVGLGKTVEAGLILKEYLMRGLARKVLILTPPALLGQWREEMTDKFDIELTGHTDPQFRAQGADAWQKFDRVIASLSTAKTAGNSAEVHKLSYDMVIVDEAHHLRNRDTLNWKFVNGIKSKYILLLTATPAQNNLDELFNLITLLSPGQLKTISGFRREFVDKKDARMPRNRTKLRELLMDVMIRNTRDQVNIALPPRKAHTLRVELNPHERALYNGVSAFVRENATQAGQRRMIGQTLLTEVGSSSNAVASTLARLHDRHPALRDQIDRLGALAAAATDSAKQAALIAALRETDEKAIIFTQFRETQKALIASLEREGMSAARFDGSMSAAEKDSQVRLFANDVRALVSTDVGSEGRNLQFCHTVINYDLPWNPMRIEQRVGRVHRIGQFETVKILNLAARETVEDYVLEVLDSKINMFELVVGEIGEILGNLESEQEFEEIVFDLWANSPDDVDVKQAFECLGDRMLEARRIYAETKAYDEALFGTDFEAEE